MSATADIVAFWREAGPKKWFVGGAEFDRAMVRGGQRQEEDLAHDRRDRSQHRAGGLWGQITRNQRHLFTDDLPGRIDVHPPRELDPDHGDAHRSR